MDREELKSFQMDVVQSLEKTDWESIKYVLQEHAHHTANRLKGYLGDGVCSYTAAEYEMINHMARQLADTTKCLYVIIDAEDRYSE